MIVLKFVLPGLLTIAFILNIIGFFTPGWVVSTYPLTLGEFVDTTSIGIIPYRTIITDIFPWFGVSSVLMILTFILYLLSVPLCGFVWIKYRKNGLSRSLRVGFDALAVISLVIFLFTIISVVIIGVDLDFINNYIINGSPVFNRIPESVFYNTRESVYLGYSAYLCITSAVLMTGVSGISCFISYHCYE